MNSEGESVGATGDSFGRYGWMLGECVSAIREFYRDTERGFQELLLPSRPVTTLSISNQPRLTGDVTIDSAAVDVGNTPSYCIDIRNLTYLHKC